jgi:peptidoglycan hydrolase-like protein with peptidoglycan-binding domain
VLPDGDYGSLTREAVLGFQRTNGLRADGVAGPATRRALDAQLQQPSLDNPLHRDHEFFKQVRGNVAALDQTLGRSPDQFTDNIASALTVQARADGLSRIDQVALSPDGSKLWGVQTPPGRNDHLFDLRTNVPTSEATTPMVTSGARWPEAMQQFQQHEQAQAQARDATQQQSNDVTQQPVNPHLAR